ncbi:MAG: zinc metallopeptidase [Clostridia bacterium]|nr:zinc metallopeptidase [Clostridia bacterium]
MDWVTLYIIASIMLIPLFIYGSIASAGVESTFNKYSRTLSSSGLTGYAVAKKLLDDAGIKNVKIVETGGRLTDCYDPKRKELRLSSATIHSGSVAAIGVCAHEVGHAVQDHKNMFLFKLRIFIVPIVNLVNRAFVPLILLGSILGFTFYIPVVGYYIVLGSIIAYGASMVFSLITLPLEYDASKRAMRMLKETGAFSDDELKHSSKILKAAIQTYISSTLTSVAYFLRFLSYAMIFSRNRD